MLFFNYCNSFFISFNFNFNLCFNNWFFNLLVLYNKFCIP